MESKDELKEINIINRTCYYFYNLLIARNRDIYSSDVLSDKKLCKENHKNILIYDISCKTSTGAKPLRFMFDKIDGFIEVHNRVIYLILFDYGWCDKICDSIKYLMSEKSGITDSINHNFSRIRTDLYNSLPTEKELTFHNVIILIKSVVNKNKNNHYYNVFS